MRPGVHSTMTALALAVCSATTAKAQTHSLDIDLTGRVQFQFNTTSVSSAEAGTRIAGSTFETRRVRLGVGIALDDWLTGQIEPDFAMGDLRLRQAWAAIALHPAFLIRAGQFKKPFSLIQATSSSSFPVIEREVNIRGLEDALSIENTGQLSTLRGNLLIGEHFWLLEEQGYADYDMGVSIEGSHRGFGWKAGVFNGNGPDAEDENSTKSIATRATWTFDVGLPLTFGTGWSRRELNWPDASSLSTRAGNAIEVDVELGGLRRSWWLLAEAATGTNLATERRFFSAQTVVAHFRKVDAGRVEGIEPVGRVSWGDPDNGIDGDAGMLLTPGLNVYFMGRNRLMFNWDVFMPESDQFTTQHAGRAQINLYF